MFFIGSSNGKGRGVFAKKRFVKGEVIERCPIIVIPANECAQIANTVLYNYTYAWGENSEDAAIALGFGSLYNHSYEPNAGYVRVPEERSIHYIAIRDIEEGEEINVNYNGDPDDKSPLWFEVVEE